MSEMRKSYVTQIRGALTKPREAFNDITGEDMRRAMMIVLAVVALSAVSKMLYLSKIPIQTLVPQLREAPVDPEMLQRNMATFGAIGGGINALAGWILPTLIMHGAATLIAGQGDLRRLFAMTGYASTPLVIQQAIRVVDALTISPEALARFVATNNEFTGVLKIILSMNVFTLFGLMALALKAYAVAANYPTTAKKGLAIASIPYLVFLGISLIL